MITCRGTLGIICSIAKMRVKGFEGLGYTVSENTVERAIGAARQLGLLTREKHGPRGSSYEIHFDWMAEIRAAGARKRAINTRQMSVEDSAQCRVSGNDMSGIASENVGSALIGINREPSQSQPPP